jgi:transposase-like protein
MAEFPGLDALFEGRRFDSAVIDLCGRWNLRFKLSTRDLVSMRADPGLPMGHAAIVRRMHQYASELSRSGTTHV